jgi:hypothetical protein
MCGDARLGEGDGIDSHSGYEQCGLAVHQHHNSSTDNADDHEVGRSHEKQFHARDDSDSMRGCKPERWLIYLFAKVRWIANIVA